MKNNQSDFFSKIVQPYCSQFVNQQHFRIILKKWSQLKNSRPSVYEYYFKFVLFQCYTYATVCILSSNLWKSQWCTLHFGLCWTKVTMLWNNGSVNVVGKGKCRSLLNSGVRGWGLDLLDLLGCVSEQWSDYLEGIWHVVKVSLGSISLGCVVLYCNSHVEAYLCC